MATSSLAVSQLALALAASGGFAGSTWAFRIGLDTNDPRWIMAATGLLTASYIPYLTLLTHSMSATIVVTSMMSQILALGVALAIYGEPVTPMRAVGLAAAALAMLAFSLPSGTQG